MFEFLHAHYWLYALVCTSLGTTIGWMIHSALLKENERLRQQSMLALTRILRFPDELSDELKAEIENLKSKLR